MPLQQLEINKFSPDGEVLRKIRCIAGRITVFRSQSDSELEKFKRALEGKPQADRFSVLIDSANFYPQKQIFIGFGPLDQAPTQQSVGSYLIQLGAREDSIEGVLLQFGLGGLSSQSCTLLSPREWKMLRMIGIFSMSEINQIITIHEPFEEIPDQWRDVFAEKLAKSAWEKQAIIVITKMSYRPEVWIENDYISRVQLERPRQGTIGFGGGDLSSADQISALRKELGIAGTATQSPPQTLTGPDLLTPTRQKNRLSLPTFLSSPRDVGIIFSGTIICVGFLYIIQQSYSTPESEGTSVAINQSHTNNHSGQFGNSNSNDPTQNTSGINKAGNIVKAQQFGKPLIDGYPEAVQAAWIAAIEHPNTLLRPEKASKQASDENGVTNGNPSDNTSPIELLYKELSQS